MVQDDSIYSYIVFRDERSVKYSFSMLLNIVFFDARSQIHAMLPVLRIESCK